MHSSRTFRYAFILISFMFLLASCSTGGSSPPTGTTTPTSSSTVTATNTQPVTPTVTTVAVPPTQTSCPAAGTARAWITAPLALGSHQNIVYLVSEHQGTGTTDTLKRYDLTSGNKTEIVKLPGVYISEAQVSADGQWLLFVSRVNQQAMLQMVRMDGQGLQTLYCLNGDITNVLWSANEQSILFNLSAPPQGAGGIYLLNLKSGTIQLEVQPSDSGAPLHIKFVGTLLTWLDNTRAYVSFANFPIAPQDSLGLLDTSRGPNQKMSDLTTVFQQKFSPPFNYPCWNADSSFDGSTLFVSQCSGISAPNCSGSCSLGTREGPSTINTEPAPGGSQHTILTNQTLGIAAVRAISSGTLLLQIENFSENHPFDPSQNGLWKVNTDGTNLTRLTTEVKGIPSSLCQFSQNPWSNVSRDGSMYALETTSTGSYPETYSLYTGSLNGGAPQSFASIADGTQLAIVGWTTM